MKISLAWLCDHLPVRFNDINVEQLVAQLTQITAEVERIRYITIAQDSLSLVRIVELQNDALICQDQDSGARLVMPYRKDLMVGDSALVVRDQQSRWATLEDLGAQRNDVVPAVFVPDHDRDDWRSLVEWQDVIFEFDNKAINHRPDLWGHRGFAREVAAILTIPLIDEAKICQRWPLQQAYQEATTKTSPFTVRITDFTACKRLAAFHCPHLANEASHLFLASRLARVDAKPMRSIIDLTNYVMFDVSQPMHAFDAEKITTHQLVAEHAHEGQNLELLDGDEITLASQDIVISDGVRPLSLAGIMGGVSSAITDRTSSIILESAHFDPASIRATSSRLKKRSEASSRFEKGLDPQQNIMAIERFITLLNKLNLNKDAQYGEEIISVGQSILPVTILIAHEALEKKLGFIVPSRFAIQTLERLGFIVAFSNGRYEITVPTFRPDVKIQEDIVEEIGRFLLAHERTYELPLRSTKSFDTRVVQQRRKIKHVLAWTAAMHEVYNYNLYDASFLRELSYEPRDVIALKNPVSEHWQWLVTSLIPHLIKNVVENHTKADAIRFFELARVWEQKNGHISEHTKVSGIFWHHKTLNFYDIKALLTSFFNALSIDVHWVQEQPSEPWWSVNQTAVLMHNTTCIGFAGMTSAEFLSRIVPGQAFIFELDADYLLSYQPQEARFVEISKYQPVTLDISMFVPLSATVAQMERAITEADGRIKMVELIDFYEKPQWRDKRSLALRYTLRDLTKTMTKQDIDEVMQKVEHNVRAQGGSIR